MFNLTFTLVPFPAENPAQTDTSRLGPGTTAALTLWHMQMYFLRCPPCKSGPSQHSNIWMSQGDILQAAPTPTLSTAQDVGYHVPLQSSSMFLLPKTHANADHNVSGATAAEMHAVPPVLSAAWLLGSCWQQCGSTRLGPGSWDTVCSRWLSLAGGWQKSSASPLCWISRSCSAKKMLLADTSLDLPSPSYSVVCKCCCLPRAD